MDIIEYFKKITEDDREMLMCSDLTPAYREQLEICLMQQVYNRFRDFQLVQFEIGTFVFSKSTRHVKLNYQDYSMNDYESSLS